MRSITTLLALALLCACDDPGDGGGQAPTCERALTAFCERSFEVSGSASAWNRSFADEAECVGVLGPDGDGVVLGDDPTKPRFAVGCSFDDGRAWSACLARAEAFDGSQDAESWFYTECSVELPPE
jgi:hypothetical protein